MKRIFISAGHSVGGKDKGVPATPCSKGFTEGQLTLRLRDLIVYQLKLMGVVVYTDKDTNALSETLSFLKSIFIPTESDILIDIHFNAFNGIAKGTEVIIPLNAVKKERELATKICNLLVGFGFSNRGVKDESRTARKTLGWMRPKGYNILIEVCFMDNAKDMEIYFSKINDISYTLALAIKEEYETKC